MGTKRTGALLAAALWTALIVPGQAAAQPPPEETAQGSMMFVLDASGSMTESVPTGGTRMDAAKAAMNTLIDALPVNIHVGLEVYGTSTGSSAAEKAAGCQDVRILQPVGQVDKPAMRAQVAGIAPRGYTPIGASLQDAAAALPDTGPRAIVLVSDGIDTCAPPAPCEVAKTLAGSGVELAVHTVGFQVDPAARAELECIAQETGGEYHDAPDAESLDELLPEIADRALRFYDVIGTRAHGETSIRDAEYLPPGQYTDTVDKDTPHYYQVHVPEGATGHFTAVHVVKQDDERVDSGVELRLMDYEKRVCTAGKGFREFNYDGPETAAVSWTPSPKAKCDPAGPHYLELRWDNTRNERSDKVELLVAVEPKVEGSRGEPARGPVEYTAPAGQPDIVWGGGSFNEAATLPGPGRYLDRLNYSEYSVYKVWLDWGQALSYQVSVQDGEDVGTATAVTELRGPNRGAVREHWWTSTEYDGAAVTLDPVATPRVAYANRDGGADVRGAAQAGWYYLVLKLSPMWTDEGSPKSQPVFEIALDVSGEKTDGPRYAEVNVPSSAPPSPTTESTWTPPGSADTEITRAGAERDITWWLVGGIGAVVLFGFGVLLLLRRATRR